MKRVLMTNLYFEKYTGSELHILEMAKQFENKGYEVTIAVFRKAHPLLEENRGGIKVIECQHEKLEEEKYDIVFVQHFPVFDFLCCNYNIIFDKLIVSKLSVINEFEQLPVCMSDADMILCVSKECADVVSKQTNSIDKIRILKNCVSDDYYKKCRSEKAIELLNKNIEKIAVISNHVPKELLELSEKFKGVSKFDYIGVEYTPKLVNAELLKEYDLIITIGRTVQQCFALGIPVYVYDYFGGPGYINDDNFEIAENNNFSGRGGFGKKSSDELNNDILKGYSNAIKNLKKLHDIASEKYSYTKNFDIIYNELMEYETPYRKAEYYKGVECFRISTYSNILSGALVTANYCSQLFIDYGRGFNEEDSIRWNIIENYKITKTISIGRKVQNIRFDPCDIPCICEIYDIIIDGISRVELLKNKGRVVYPIYDPQCIIELTEADKEENVQEIKLVYCLKIIPKERIVEYYRRKVVEINSEKEKLKEEIDKKISTKIRNRFVEIKKKKEMLFTKKGDTDDEE